MKFFAIFALIIAVFAAFVAAAETGAAIEKGQVAPRNLGDCNNDSCRASCILNGHNGGSCNSNDNCDCN